MSNKENNNNDNQRVRPGNRTIGELAANARHRMSKHRRPSDFAKLCLEFDRDITGGVEVEMHVRYTLLLQFLAQLQLGKVESQLAIIWLDGHGWGEENLAWLAGEINRIRHTY